MANEATINLGLSLVGSAPINIGTSSHLDVASGLRFENTQIIGTSYEAIIFGDITAIQGVAIYNLDPTNYVEVDLANDGSKWPQRLLPRKATETYGVPLLLAPSGQAITMFAKAHTAPCNILIIPIPA